jgi:hypothetical protein
VYIVVNLIGWFPIRLFRYSAVELVKPETLLDIRSIGDHDVSEIMLTRAAASQVIVRRSGINLKLLSIR